MSDASSDRVSRRRYERAIAARKEAEQLLEQKSRELFLANQQLSAHSNELEQAVYQRTKELQRALQQAEAAGQAKSRFIATMSHEIRTPLGGMLGMIDLLTMDEVDAQKRELLNLAKTAGKSLNRIVNDVLDFSKMEAGVFVFEEEQVDIRALIESVKRLANSNEKSADREIIAEVENTVPQVFLGDATRVRQVISNFVNNALRYSTSGPIHIRTLASPHEKGAFLRIEVEDTGVGISAEGITNLFKDFSQIANPLTAAAQGAGLGLAICKRILEGLGGEIGVESTLGEGSVFWFELAVEISDAENETQNRVQMKTSKRPHILDGKRVLIAEDNIINQKLLSTYAERLNLRSDLAENGRVALEIFDPAKHDLILMDVAMPEMDGLEATRRIREKWAGTPLPPILILTAHVMDAIQEEATIVGVDTVLSKPIPFDDLKHALEIALSGAPRCEEDSISLEDDILSAEKSRKIFALMAEDVVSEMLKVFPEDSLVDLVGKYVKDCSERLEVLNQALLAGETKTLKAQAHSIKGSSMVLGFPEMSEWASQVEAGAIEGRTMPELLSLMETWLTEIHALL